VAETQTKARAKPRVTRSKRAVEKVARSYYAAIANRDADAVAAHWAEDGVHEVVPLGIVRGREAVRSYFREILSAVPDVETTVERLVADAQRAAVEWKLSGHFTGGPFQGIEPTERPIELRGLDLLEVEGGELKHASVYYDGAEFARQVGMLPPQGSGAERAMKSTRNAVTRMRKALNERRGA
jgi:steroid delta-isomerase-like uncharacterized protein